MPKTILIAEDDNFLQKMLRYSLEEEGFSVLSAENGEVAIEKIEKEKPDLVLLDILMPKVDGFAVLEHLQEHKIRVPVVITSNLGHQDDVDKCMKLGAKDYIIKSDTESTDLVEKVKKYL